MNKALFKDTWRTMERTKSRFISLVAIVALGISFFASKAPPEGYFPAISFVPNE